MKFIYILVLLTLAGCDVPGRYQIAVVGHTSTDEDRVWVIDTKTGGVSLCYESAAQIHCLKSEPPNLQF